jgi:DNA-binding LacI/PurR family transcriptional regulator
MAVSDMTRRPTLADVAKLAGVSSATASMVLNKRSGRVPISEETRGRVLQAVKQLSYVPNPVAQMLAGGASRLIGVFAYEARFPYERQDFFFQYLLGIEREASRQDYDLLLFTRGRDCQSRAIYCDGVNQLRLADGAIIMGSQTNREELRLLAEEGYPFVSIGRREVTGHRISWVASDYTAGSAEATRRLIELGHRRLAFLGMGPPPETSAEKLQGCRDALAGVEGSGLAVWERDLLSTPDVFIQAMRSFAPTALICAEIATLASAVSILIAASYRIPDDLSMVSLTDGEANIPLGMRPTAVGLNRHLMGEMAVRILIDQMQRAIAPPQQMRSACQLIQGNTTAPPSQLR